MSAAKRASVRGKKTATKTVSKTVGSLRAVKKATSQKKRRSTPTVTKKTVKKVTKKTTKKVVKRVRARVVKRPKNAPPQSVREARYGGHQNTIPTSPKAPGRLLGRTFTLSAAGVVSSQATNADAIAIAIARFGGIGIMVCGAALSWNIYNQLVTMPAGVQTASVISAEATITPSLTLTASSPLREPASAVVSVADADTVVLTLRSDTDTIVLGEAHQRTDATWEYRIDPALISAGDYRLQAFMATANGYETLEYEQMISIANPIPDEPLTTTSDATTTPELASTSVPAVVGEADTTVAPTTTMPTLFAPRIAMLAPLTPETVLVLGEGTPNQPLELLLLRDQQRATTSVQANGWWSLTIDTPAPGSHYEIYAQASPEFLSGPLDFSVIAGRLIRADEPMRTQATLVAESNPARESLMGYLLVSVGIVALGSVLLLIGHHLYYLRRAPKEPSAVLDQST